MRRLVFPAGPFPEWKDKLQEHKWLTMSQEDFPEGFRQAPK